MLEELVSTIVGILLTFFAIPLIRMNLNVVIDFCWTVLFVAAAVAKITNKWCHWPNCVNASAVPFISIGEIQPIIYGNSTQIVIKSKLGVSSTKFFFHI